VGTSLKLWRLVLTIPVEYRSALKQLRAVRMPRWRFSRNGRSPDAYRKLLGKRPLALTAKTAAAYLELGNASIDVYEKLDALATTFLTRTYTGSIKSPYNTIKASICSRVRSSTGWLGMLHSLKLMAFSSRHCPLSDRH
jgi:hypothetical protein